VLTDVKSTLSVGDTLVPLIFMYNGTHLSNFAGDKKEWPVYDNWQSIFEGPPDALNTERRNIRSPADSDQEPQYSSDAAG